MEILVIGSCTKSKRDDGCPENIRLTESDFDDQTRLRAREKELANWLRPAAEMYTGRQHTQMMKGVRILRSVPGLVTCDVAIVSAGYGVLTERRPIAPYDITFHGMRKPLIRQRGERLGIPDAIRGAMRDYAVVFILLGEDYLLSVRPPLVPNNGQKFIAFRSPKLRQVPNGDVVIVPAGESAAEEFGEAPRSLKGRLFYLLAKGLAQEPKMWEQLVRDRTTDTILSLMKMGSQIA
jgi:hypothetical protein